MHFYHFACKVVLKMAKEIRKRRDMGSPLQAVNSKYKTVDTALRPYHTGWISIHKGARVGSGWRFLLSCPI